MLPLLDKLREYPVVPSVNNSKMLSYALQESRQACIMLKMGDINSLPRIVDLIHRYDRKVLLHQDSIGGLAKDKAGINFLERIGVDAVITMKPHCVHMIKEKKMTAILGMFVIDSNALNLGVANIIEHKPHYATVMPMTLPEKVYRFITAETNTPIIAGGLATEADQLQQVFNWGLKGLQ
jgi:glycerol uptake operon antiterminator